ncbi:suppressor of fused domain protein, partial [Xanthomonas sp. Kuri4-2]
LRPQRGRYPVPGLDGFAVVVRPSELRDGAGNVVETLG